MEVTDQLILGGMVLGALETGRLEMHAQDYCAIASSAALELSFLDTNALASVSANLPSSLHGLIDNLLRARRNWESCSEALGTRMIDSVIRRYKLPSVSRAES